MDCVIFCERLCKEHEEILRFSETWEEALNLLTSADGRERSGSLARLRELQNHLIEIRKHCRAEERSADSPFRLYLEPAEREELRSQHELLERRIGDFANELLFASADRTDELVRLGRQMLEHLRHYIVFEEALLERLEQSHGMEKISGRALR